ncbi:anion permease [Paenibacillus sp. GSMTC-2017]|uniref:SLC13 family permease n=1 Tax=Paenibacillus sp. GSMTC-2017 TaxID=2794350 RepID=UPI0018D66884|nr:SLC13 family permease [Paenibacillus sp. GSMTC-2017]MBH5316260.1 anion permease [Paenibacillus sp. GSMTC-2017]
MTQIVSFIRSGVHTYRLSFILLIILSVAIQLPTSLSTDGKITLFALGMATILWTTTSINSAYIAIGMVSIIILLGGGKQELLFHSLSSDIVWLMIGTFILGGALQVTGLAGRLTLTLLNRAKTVGGLFWLLATALQPLALFIPSTSGRASVTLPVFRSLAGYLNDAKITKALALLMPTIILVSTVSTLIGAGSHLIAVDLLTKVSGEGISFIQWILWGLPFGIVSSYCSCWVLLRLFLTKEQRQSSINTNTLITAIKNNSHSNSENSFSTHEKRTLGIVLLMIIGWLTESIHGLEIAMVTIIGVLILTMPKFGVISWKDGLKHVSWNLIIFVGAALALGQSLIDSGASDWIKDSLFAATQSLDGQSTFAVLVVVILLSLTSHIYMTSHTTRAIVMVPPLLFLASALELNPVAVIFIGTIGMDYCLTFPVSSKALLLFQETETETFAPRDLLRLSAVLIVVHALLMVGFYYGYWQWTGLKL